LYDELASKKLELFGFDEIIAKQNTKIKDTEAKHKQSRAKDVETDKATEAKAKEDNEFDK
jgi:hypothetical protein